MPDDTDWTAEMIEAEKRRRYDNFLSVVHAPPSEEPPVEDPPIEE